MLTGFAQRYGCAMSPEAAKKSLARLAALLIEARMVLTCTDTTLTPTVKKKKLEHLVSKVGDSSKTYGVTMSNLVLKPLLSKCMSTVVNPR